MNLRSVDLNLLVVLDALLEDRHVSRAALRVGLSQPATSNCLARLRAAFGDPLLVRTRGGMELTARGQELMAPVHQILREVEGLFASDVRFDPAQCERQFVLRMSDLLSHLFLAAVTQALLREAPHSSLKVVHLPPELTIKALEADTCDVALSTGLVREAAIRCQPLLSDRMVCVMRRGHNAARGEFDLERLLKQDHLRVSISPIDNRFVDDALAQLGRKRRISVIIPHWLVIPSILHATDLVAVIPKRLAHTLTPERDGFLQRDLPLVFPPFHWCLYWHRRHDGSRLHRWLRAKIAAVVQSSRGATRQPPGARAG